MTRPITIRPSGMPQYSDCGRRSAARGWQAIVEAAGYQLRTTLPSIGAIIGTATHTLMGYALKKRLADAVAEHADLRNLAGDTINKELAPAAGVVWDDTTRNKDAAIQQATKQALAVIQYMPDLRPTAIEEFGVADLGDGFQMAGTLDLRTHLPETEIAPGQFLSEGEGIDDLKTGTTQRANQAQYGGYSLLNRAQGRSTRRLREIFVQRVGVTKPQPAPVIVEYPVAQAETIAWHTAQHTKRELIAFQKSGNPWVWLPNPNSMMCGADYCPAFGTEFCTSHKQAKGT